LKTDESIFVWKKSVKINLGIDTNYMCILEICVFKVWNKTSRSRLNALISWHSSKDDPWKLFCLFLMFNEVSGGCSPSWSLWNCWLSLFKLFFFELVVVKLLIFTFYTFFSSWSLWNCWLSLFNILFWAGHCGIVDLHFLNLIFQAGHCGIVDFHFLNLIFRAGHCGIVDLHF